MSVHNIHVYIKLKPQIINFLESYGVNCKNIIA